MTDAERDALFFRHKKGRYGPGGKWENATRPMEGGTAVAVNASRPQAAAYRPHNGAVIEQSRELMPEPIPQAEAMMPYCPPRMQAIPGESKNAQAESWEGFPEMETTEAEPVTAAMIFIDQRPAGHRY